MKKVKALLCNLFGKRASVVARDGYLNFEHGWYVFGKWIGED